MRFLAFLPLLATILVSCAQPPKTPLPIANLHKTVYISEKFLPEQEDAIMTGLKDWETATNRKVRLHIHLHADALDLKFLYTNDIFIDRVDNNDARIALSDRRMRIGNPNFLTGGLCFPATDKTGSLILVDDERIWNNNLEQLVEHEVGHAFHLDHADPGSIMSNNIMDAPNTPTDDDVANLYGIYGIDSK